VIIDRALAIAAGVLAFATTAIAQDACHHVEPGRTSLVYGARHAFLIQAPSGWERLVVPRIPAAFHRVGETWQDGPAVMYVNTITSDSGPAQTPEKAFLDDSVRFAHSVENLVIENLPKISTADGRDALVRTFRGDPPAQVEVVAYVRETTVTPIIVLSARTADDYKRAIPEFMALVGSYEFITANRRDGDGPPCGAVKVP
jgi:hypothetical protein